LRCRQAGFLVLQAPDGRAALTTFEQEQPDLVILDYNLPHLSGLEVLKRLRSAGTRTPIMMLTVRAARKDQVEALGGRRGRLPDQAVQPPGSDCPVARTPAPGWR